jgi:DNA-binding PadR family transcriptional regulator
MPTTDILGGFEHRVLLATLHLRAEAFTASIVDELESRSGREVAPAAVYIALKRLEKRGLVASEVRKEEGSGTVRPRRYFEVTSSGVDLLRETRSELNRLWSGLEALDSG